MSDNYDILQLKFSMNEDCIGVSVFQVMIHYITIITTRLKEGQSKLGKIMFTGFVN